MPDRVLAPQVIFLAYELDQVGQIFLVDDEFLFAVRLRTNSWAGLEKLKVLSFEILTKDVAYILSSLGFFARLICNFEQRIMSSFNKQNLIKISRLQAACRGVEANVETKHTGIIVGINPTSGDCPMEIHHSN